MPFRMPARYAGRCRCARPVRPGDEIAFERGVGVVGCTTCGFSGNRPEAVEAAATSPADLAAALTALNLRLTSEQAAVAAWRPGAQNLRVVAAAGSGKTTTTVALVGNLLAAGHAPEKIVVTTFTAKAAAELVERLARVVTPGDLAAMNVGTFHSIAGRALRSTGQWDQRRNVDVPGRANDCIGAATLWTRALGTAPIMGLGGGPGIGAGMEAEREYPLAVEAACRSMGFKVRSPEARAACEATGLLDLHTAWDLYEQQKRAQQSWDFADLLVAFHERALSLGGFTVIVDEAQDNSTLQLSIARELAKQGGNVVLVGDVRQSIYEWRGAAPDLFLHADSTIGAQTLYLSANYRSGAAIVELGNAIAEGRTWSLGPVARAARNVTGKVTVSGYTDVGSEADATATEVAALMAEGAQATDFAILCRTRAQQGVSEAALLTKHVPVAIVGGQSYFAGREWRDFAAFAALACGGASGDDVTRVVRGSDGCGYRAADEAARAFAQTGDALSALADAADKARAARTRTALVTLHAFVRDARTLPYGAALEAVATRLSAATSHEEGDADARASFEAAARIAKGFENLAAARAFGARCEGAAVAVRDNEDAPEGRVCISTIHKAKGREWKQVFVSATHGVFPHYRCGDEGKRFEEEGRLFYVACTRAADTLRLSYCVDYSKVQGGPSMFLDFVTEDGNGDGPQGGKAPTAPAAAPAASNAAPVAPAHVAAPVAASEAVSAAVEGFERDAADLRVALAADKARAEALADAGEQPAPGQRFVPVALADFAALLDRHGFAADATATDRSGQVALSVALTGATKLVVYTSVPKGDVEVRDVGEDSIKVALIGPKGRPLMRKQPYACRTRGWRSTLLDRLDTALATLGAPCVACGGPTVARESTRGTFHGCASYPECKGFAVRRAAR